MKRKIVGYHKDELDDWVAELDCYHNQHVRHKPPFFNRPWVETEAGREEMLGFELDCVRCDQFEFPEDIQSYNRSPEFTEQTVPAALLKDHSTKVGTWGKIRLLIGELEYTAGDHIEHLHANESAVVVPKMLHSVKPIGKVKFFVEFYRREKTKTE